MHNSVNVLPSNDLTPFSHPFSNDLNSKDKARQLHRLLLDCARDESEKEVSSMYRKAADFFRETFFGKTEAQIKAAILEVLRDYCDGSDSHPLEVINLVELTGISEKELIPVLGGMVLSGEIIQGRRRRYNEAGNHYNAIYKLKK